MSEVLQAQSRGDGETGAQGRHRSKMGPGIYQLGAWGTGRGWRGQMKFLGTV